MITFEDLKQRVKECSEEVGLEEHKAFIYFVLEELKDLSREEAEEYITDGPYDGGIDVIYPNKEDKELLLLQSKYTENIDSNTLENGIRDLIRGIKYVAGERKKPAPRLDEKIKKLEVEPLMATDDLKLNAVFITSAKVGTTKEEKRKVEKKHLRNLEKFLEERGLGIEAEFKIFDFRTISEVLGELPGIENVSFPLYKDEFFIKHDKSAAVLTIDGPKLGDFVEKFAEDLFENNVRRFLGFRGNINKGIRKTLEDEEERKLFWFYNNGIVGVCEDFEEEENKIIFKNFSIVNGAQTAHIVSDINKSVFTLTDVGILLKVVNLSKIPEPDKFDLIGRITLAANSQNPTNTRDLRSVDRVQKTLEQKFKDIGYLYIRRRGIRIKKTEKTIFMKDLAQAYVPFYMDEPYTAYSRVNEVFSKNDYYENVFPKTILGDKEEEINKLLSQYLLSHKLLQLVRNHIKQIPSFIPLALMYHTLWAFKQACAVEKIELDKLNHRDADKFAEQIFNERREKTLQACKLAYTNLQSIGGGFELPKSAKSREGFDKFKEAFKTNYGSI